MKVVNITTRTSHYASFSMSGMGCILNGRLARGQAKKPLPSLEQVKADLGSATAASKEVPVGLYPLGE